uniref:Capsid protein n=1 Tax=Zosterops erythropleurus Genomoviridae sp. TaxID=2814957 RepID=A0A8E7G1X0_9VIRU|nr:MAG: capsid protein [Gemykolovirus]
MAYSKPRRRYVRRRSGGRKKRTYVRSVKKRTYRKKGAMSKKRILNVTSRKKKNTMMQYANTSNVTGASVPIGPGPMLVNGANQYWGVFTPTAMDLTSGADVQNSIVDSSLRTSQTCFIRGFAENIRIETSTGLPWYWRRIVFTAKSAPWFNLSPNDTPTQTNSGSTSSIESSTNGWERLYFNQFVNNAPDTISRMQREIFRGEQNRDWSDILTASIDTARVDLMSDRITVIKSGNQVGTNRAFKKFYQCNKNLVYNDDESGVVETTNAISVQDKRGMGNLHILDIFLPGTGGGTGDILKLTSTSTLYWHEK